MSDFNVYIDFWHVLDYLNFSSGKITLDLTFPSIDSVFITLWNAHYSHLNKLFGERHLFTKTTDFKNMYAWQYYTPTM